MASICCPASTTPSPISSRIGIGSEFAMLTKSRRAVVCLLCVFSLIAGVGTLCWRKSRSGAADPASGQQSRPAAPHARRIPDLIESLRTARSPEVWQQSCAELRKQFAAMPPAEAAKIIRDLLDSKVDTATHLSFTIGADGFLT